MGKKEKILLLFCVGLLVIGGITMTELVFGFGDLPEMPAITPRQKQLKYLKEHEQEIIDFVKAQNPKIESVQIDWDDVRFNEPGMFTPGGSIDIYGEFNHIADSGWGIMVPIEDGQVNLDSMILGNDLRIGGQLYE